MKILATVALLIATSFPAFAAECVAPVIQSSLVEMKDAGLDVPDMVVVSDPNEVDGIATRIVNLLGQAPFDIDSTAVINHVQVSGVTYFEFVGSDGCLLGSGKITDANEADQVLG